MSRIRAPRAPLALLNGTQVRWLGALLLAVQLPQAYYMPGWVAVLGMLLVVVRMALQRRSLAERDRLLARVPSYVLALMALGVAIALRYTYGIFLGRDPCVAFLFMLVAIKFVEARTVRDGTLLVCLAMFLMVTPFFYNQSLLAAVAAIPGLVLLAAALQWLAPPGSIRGEKRLRDPLRRALRLLIEGIPLAVLLFVLFPRLSGPLWGLPSDVAARTGLSERMHPGSISELSLSDAVAFRVDFATPIPPSHSRYWRGPVFSRFDGEEWSATTGRRGARIALSPGAATVLYTVTLEPHYKTSLFALDLPASLPQSTDPGPDDRNTELGYLTRDQQLLARIPVVHALRYTQVSMIASSYRAMPGSAGELERRENLELPHGSPRTRALAQALRAAHPDDPGYIDAVLAWFRAEPFYYTLSPPRLERDPVDGFLFDTRRGFCEHYAGAFVVLLRAAGIPARVVTGYQGGEVNPNGGYLIVRQSDAHAWAEALVNGAWQRFDPTAAVAPSRIELGLGGALPSDDRVPLLARRNEGWIRTLQLAWDAVNYDWRRNVVGFNFEQQRTLWRYLRLERWAPWQVVFGVSLLTAAWAGGLLLWFALRHRQRDDRIVLSWNALCRRLARAGLPREAHEGPVAYLQRATLRWPAFAAAFTVIGGGVRRAALRPHRERHQRGDRPRARPFPARDRRAADLAHAAKERRAGMNVLQLPRPTRGTVQATH